MHKGHVPTQQMRFIGLGKERGLRGLRGRIIGGVFLVRGSMACTKDGRVLAPLAIPPANPVAVGKAILLYH